MHVAARARCAARLRRAALSTFATRELGPTHLNPGHSAAPAAKLASFSASSAHLSKASLSRARLLSLSLNPCCEGPMALPCPTRAPCPPSLDTSLGRAAGRGAASTMSLAPGSWATLRPQAMGPTQRLMLLHSSAAPALHGAQFPETLAAPLGCAGPQRGVGVHAAHQAQQDRSASSRGPASKGQGQSGSKGKRATGRLAETRDKRGAKDNETISKAAGSSRRLDLSAIESYDPSREGSRAAREKRSPDKASSDASENRPVGDGPAFAEMTLPEAVTALLRSRGLEKSTLIQAAAIPKLLRGHDCVIQSYTGSGKTLVYLIPILMALAPGGWPAEVEGTRGSATQADGLGGAKARAQGVQAVVVAPSQELAMQIVKEAQRLLHPELKGCVQQLIGGANQRRQEEALKRNKPAIVVGTPGRIAEISRAGKLQTHGCRFLVLDEADALLSHKFRPDMLRILEHVGRRRGQGQPPRSGSGEGSLPGGAEKRTERQTVLVSATMSGAVIDAATRWGQSPFLIQCTAQGVVPPRRLAPPNLAAAEIITVEGTTRLSAPPEALTRGWGGLGESAEAGSSAGSWDGPEESEGGNGAEPAMESAGVGAATALHSVAASLSPTLSHYFIVVSQRHRVEVLRRCLAATGAQSAMVFMNFPQRLQDVQHKLEARGVTSAVLHGQMQKLARASVLAQFRSKKVQVLLLSDLGARGLDVEECDLVVNLELPSGAAHYAHRAGRTGRLGRRGTVISICEEPEAFVVEKLRKQLGVRIIRAEAVGGELLPYEGRMKL